MDITNLIMIKTGLNEMMKNISKRANAIEDNRQFCIFIGDTYPIVWDGKNMGYANVLTCSNFNAQEAKKIVDGMGNFNNLPIGRVINLKEILENNLKLVKNEIQKADKVIEGNLQLMAN